MRVSFAHGTTLVEENIQKILELITSDNALCTLQEMRERYPFGARKRQRYQKRFSVQSVCYYEQKITKNCGCLWDVFGMLVR